MAAGRLFLVPAWLSEDTPPQRAVPEGTLARLRMLEHFVVEDAKSARRYLAACGHPKPIREITFAELNEHTPPSAVPALLEPALAGRDIGLLSEAGLPAVADPGALLVALAHARDVTVVPLAGPSSIMLALMASGLEGQRFRFLGYLPVDSAARRAKLAQIERHSANAAETQIFIETPYRNDALLADVLQSCAESTRLAVAADLTGPSEWIRMSSVGEWRRKPQVIGKRPAIFLLWGQTPISTAPKLGPVPQ
jgi:16S rRNA (cytidine1402-2'-O)-methyltransferase